VFQLLGSEPITVRPAPSLNGGLQVVVNFRRNAVEQRLQGSGVRRGRRV
jgi:hypothetical protein